MKDYKLGLHVCIVAQPLSPSTVAKRLRLPRARGKRARERARTRPEPVPIYRSKKPAFASCARGKRAKRDHRGGTGRNGCRCVYCGWALEPMSAHASTCSRACLVVCLHLERKFSDKLLLSTSPASFKTRFFFVLFHLTLEFFLLACAGSSCISRIVQCCGTLGSCCSS